MAAASTQPKLAFCAIAGKQLLAAWLQSSRHPGDRFNLGVWQVDYSAVDQQGNTAPGVMHLPSGSEGGALYD